MILDEKSYLFILFFLYAGVIIHRIGFLEGVMNILIVACIVILAIKGAQQ